MILKPGSIGELTEGLQQAQARCEPVRSFDLHSLARVVDYAPEDMTVTVEAGITLAALQDHLSQHRQWLPIDPPHADAITIGALLATNANGPRRFGFGTVREHLIGLKVALAGGQLVKAGGKVVKNVAGYDLCKLFVGSQGSLGVIVEATFKLRPLPEAERFVQVRCDSLGQAAAILQRVLSSDLTPIVLDLHNLALPDAVPSPAFSVVIGLAGTRREVEAQLSEAGELGLSDAATLQHEFAFWRSIKWGECGRLSVLPTNLADALGGIGNVPFVARAGNGVAYYHGNAAKAPVADLPVELLRRVKEAYDPKHILPDMIL